MRVSGADRFCAGCGATLETYPEQPAAKVVTLKGWPTAVIALVALALVAWPLLSGLDLSPATAKSSASGEAKTIGMKVVKPKTCTSKKHDFSLKLPRSWFEETGDHNNCTIFSFEVDDGSAATLHVFPDLGDFDKAVPDADLVTDTKGNLAGTPATFFAHKDGGRAHFIYHMDRKGRIFSLELVADENVTQRTKRTFDQVARSVDFL
jgi:hypothetical protein